jgi:hypothetical protein
MLQKFLIPLFLVIVVAGLIVTNIGEGFLGFKDTATAENIMKVAEEYEQASKAYAAAYGDGYVAYGDPSLGEDIFVYLKSKELIQFDEANQVDLTWGLSSDKTKLQAIMKKESLCQYINHKRNQTPLSDPVPTCGTPEGDAVSCCKAP